MTKRKSPDELTSGPNHPLDRGSNEGVIKP